MGQYHLIYNLDKKEYLSLGGAKLWEKASNIPSTMALLVLMANSNGRGGGDLNNPIMDYKRPGKKTSYESWSNEKQKNIKHTKKEFTANQKALETIQGRWAGDRILVQGDYAKETDTAYVKENEKFKDITNVVLKALVVLLKDDEILDELSYEIDNVV